MTPQQGCGLLLLFLDQAPQVLPVVREACEKHVLAKYVYKAVAQMFHAGMPRTGDSVRKCLKANGNHVATASDFVSDRFLMDCMRTVVDGSLDDFLEKTKGKAKQ